MGEPHEGQHGQVVLAAFEPADVGPVQPGEGGELFLAEPEGSTQDPHPQADLPDVVVFRMRGLPTGPGDRLDADDGRARRRRSWAARGLWRQQVGRLDAQSLDQVDQPLDAEAGLAALQQANERAMQAGALGQFLLGQTGLDPQQLEA